MMYSPALTGGCAAAGVTGLPSARAAADASAAAAASPAPSPVQAAAAGGTGIVSTTASKSQLQKKTREWRVVSALRFTTRCSVLLPGAEFGVGVQGGVGLGVEQGGQGQESDGW